MHYLISSTSFEPSQFEASLIQTSGQSYSRLVPHTPCWSYVEADVDTASQKGARCEDYRVSSHLTAVIWEKYRNITRVASWGPDRRKWLFSEVRGGIWTPHSPVLIKISADKRPLNQLTVKNLFFSLFIITFCHEHHHIVHEKTINLSVWIKEICTLLVKLHIFSPECKELTSMLDPLLYRWGVPPVVIRCVHWTMQMGVLQTWIKALGLDIVMHKEETPLRRVQVVNP